MDFSDISILGGMFAIAMGLIEVIKALVRKRVANGGGELKALAEIAREQLAALRSIEKGLDSTRSDIRVMSLEQAHVQKVVERIEEKVA